MAPKGAPKEEWNVDNTVTVSGKEVVGFSHESLLNYGEFRENFEESVAEAYLNPRWNQEQVQIMFKGAEGSTPIPLGMEIDEMDSAL